MKSAILAFVMFLISSSYGFAGLKQEPVILNQATSPLKITEFKLKYGKEFGSSYEGLYCNLKYQNIMDKKVQAMSFQFIFFDVFNEHLRTFGGFAIEDINPGAAKTGKWTPSFYSDYSTHTCFVYVGKARFEDGSIWSANEDEMLETINTQMESKLSIEELEEKKE